EVEGRAPLRDSIDHGSGHWRCVAWVGLQLARETPGCDPAVVFLFALFHDSQRENEVSDPEHGPRGARLADEMHGEYFRIAPERLSLLREACSRHNGGDPVPDPTVGVCLDADRLNLYRIGKTPSARYLSTGAGKARIDWARNQCRREFTWAELYEAYRALDGPSDNRTPEDDPPAIPGGGDGVRASGPEPAARVLEGILPAEHRHACLDALANSVTLANAHGESLWSVSLLD